MKYLSWTYQINPIIRPLPDDPAQYSATIRSQSSLPTTSRRTAKFHPASSGWGLLITLAVRAACTAAPLDNYPLGTTCSLGALELKESISNLLVGSEVFTPIWWTYNIPISSRPTRLVTNIAGGTGVPRMFSPEACCCGAGGQGGHAHGCDDWETHCLFWLDWIVNAVKVGRLRV